MRGDMAYKGSVELSAAKETEQGTTRMHGVTSATMGKQLEHMPP